VNVGTMPLNPFAGVNVIAPVVGSMVATPMLADGVVARAKVKGPVPAGVAGVSVNG
jgi:hypothetical protein